LSGNTGTGPHQGNAERAQGFRVNACRSARNPHKLNSETATGSGAATPRKLRTDTCCFRRAKVQF
jgi:hypothetical protein